MNSKDNLGMRWYFTRVSVFSQGLQRKEVDVIKRAYGNPEHHADKRGCR
jgi:hypothetical protein